MLPGFRFLFAAIVLSTSVLIFGLGAAALLRAAHEQFAGIPQRRLPPELVFTRQIDPPVPTLALLRVEPEVTMLRIEPEVTEKVPESAAVPIPETVIPTVQVPEEAPAEPEKEKVAALKLEEPAPAGTVKPEIPAAEATPAVQVAPPETPAAETPAAETPVTETPAANEEVKLAAIAETPAPAPSTASTETAPVVETPSLEGAATKIATLGGPAVVIEEPASARTAAAKPDRSVEKKRAQRTKERRRIAARRAQLARQAAAQQLADPFGLTPVRGKQ